MAKIKIAIVGVGNCASALIQGIHYYRGKKASDAIGLMHWNLGGHAPGDIQVVAAFDIDRRKVGRDVSEAIFAKPNCTKVFCRNVPRTGVKVRMGRILDGVAGHMKNYDADCSFLPAAAREADARTVVKALKESGAEVLLNYLPVGSEKAVTFYAQCALDARVAFINMMPVFIASRPDRERRFAEKRIPIVGDDIKAQIGAAIVHRVLSALIENSKEAMEGPGHVKVITRGQVVSLGAARTTVPPPGRYACLQVEDDGRGVDWDAVRTSAIRRGLLPARHPGEDDLKELHALLFSPGFTTALPSELVGDGILDRRFPGLRKTAGRVPARVRVTRTLPVSWWPKEPTSSAWTCSTS